MSGARETARDAAREAAARALIAVYRTLWPGAGWPGLDEAERMATAAIDAFTRSTGAPTYADGIEDAAKVAETFQARPDLLPMCNADMNKGAERGMYEAAEEIAAAIRARLHAKEEQR